MAKRYLEQSIDFLGFLGAKLRDLKGYSTLANELLQNADDAPEVTQVSFDINEMALFVENNGSFRDKDFDRLRRIAAGQKSLELNTIGTFGIGFLSVYQITDNPIIVSAGKKWTFYPEANEQQRIIEIETKDYGKTYFGFPWARNPNSQVRTKLKLEHITEKTIQDFTYELMTILPRNILFLRKIENVVVKENGKVIKDISRLPVKDNIMSFNIDEKRTDWFVIKTHFNKVALELRRKFSYHIEDKREADVQLAIPHDFFKFQGEFYAYLPTSHQTSLPFHINADFFTSTDRKRVLFENDFQAQWNQSAILAASYSLMDNLDKISEFLGPREFWSFLERIYEAYLKSVDGYNAPVIKKVWEILQTKLAAEKIVYTSKGEWVHAKDAFLLKDEKEYELLPIFEKMGLHIVHFDLYEKFKLLRNESINVPVLSIYDLAKALNANGFNKNRELKEAPEWFQSDFERDKLAEEITRLLERIEPEEKERALDAIQSCHIAISYLNKLSAPKSLWIASDDEARLFGDLDLAFVFTSDSNPKGIKSLISQFDVYAAIDVVNLGVRDLFDASDVNHLEAFWNKEPKSIIHLIDWFDQHRTIIKNDPVLIDRIRKLTIWPSGFKLYSLEQLFIPGNFEDPLNLSMIIDKSILSHYRDLLNDLKVNELNIVNYTKDFVPELFKNKKKLPKAKRQELVLLLSRYLGEIWGNEEIRLTYRDLPIVECNDGVFRKATEVYFHDNDLLSILGQSGKFVKQSIEKRKSLLELYRWLDINTIPKPNDIKEKIKAITEAIPDFENRNTAQEIFAYLGTVWKQIDMKQRENYDFLKTEKWLPVEDDYENWYSPKEVYTRFNSYLFKSQVKFLDIERQKLFGAFIRFLNIPSKPECDMVVSHILHCIKNKQDINPLIYKYLNRYYQLACIDRLKNKPFIHLPGEGFFTADKVFLGKHAFGHFRKQLDAKWYNYSDLLKKLGVKEDPQPRDALFVIQDIQNEYARSGRPVSDGIVSILEYCYRFINAMPVEEIKKVKENMVVANHKNILVSPEKVFFNDRPNISAYLGEDIKNQFVTLSINSFRAKRAVGVRMLSEALSSHVVKVDKQKQDAELVARIQNRKDLFTQIASSITMNSEEMVNFDFIDTLNVYQADSLQVEFSLSVNGHKQQAKPDSVNAYYDASKNSLYYCSKSGIPWASIARELAFHILPFKNVGWLSPVLKEVLSSESKTQAYNALSELGFEITETFKEEKEEPAFIMQ